MANDPKALTETPEFKTAVAEAVAAEAGKILAALKNEGTALSSSDHKFAENLAMAFATLSEQGTGRKYVAPEILRMRSQAREEMFNLIVAARKARNAAIDKIRDERNRDPKTSEMIAIDKEFVPSYVVTAKTHLDNQVVQPFWVDSNHIAQPTEIDWPGVPNDALKPLNAVARGIHAAFLESIGSKPQSVSATGATFDAPDPMNDGYGTTANGLVVRGGAIPRQNRHPEMQEQGGEEGLSLHHKNKPGRTVPVRVLGTIAPPAQQTV